MLESEEADLMKTGEPPPVFVAGGELGMRPSNMGIRSAVNRGGTSDVDLAPPTQLRRINEDGDAVPGSQDSELARRTQVQLQIESANTLKDAAGSQDAVLAERAQAALSMSDPPERARRRISAGARPVTTPMLTCAQCGPAPDAFLALEDR
jgi:hypothetical protein